MKLFFKKKDNLLFIRPKNYRGENLFVFNPDRNTFLMTTNQRLEEDLKIDTIFLYCFILNIYNIIKKEFEEISIFSNVLIDKIPFNLSDILSFFDQYKCEQKIYHIDGKFYKPNINGIIDREFIYEDKNDLILTHLDYTYQELLLRPDLQNNRIIIHDSNNKTYSISEEEFQTIVEQTILLNI